MKQALAILLFGFLLLLAVLASVAGGVVALQVAGFVGGIVLLAVGLGSVADGISR